MSELCNFHFSSENEVDGAKDKIEFDAKGYKNIENEKIIYYFKHEHKYKFTTQKDILEVNVDDSKYTFVENKKTEAFIKNDGYHFKASIFTKNLDISNSKICISYILDFGQFQGHYVITLKLY